MKPPAKNILYGLYVQALTFIGLLLKYIIHGCIPKHSLTAIKPSQACYLISLAT